MSYDKKLVEEQRKYGIVTCKICNQRKVKNWNIYKNNICGTECSGKLIEKILSNPELQRTLTANPLQ